MPINPPPRIEPIVLEDSHIANQIMPANGEKMFYEQALCKLSDKILDLENVNIEQMQKAYDYIRDEIVNKIPSDYDKNNTIDFWYKQSRITRNLKILGINEYSFISSTHAINKLKENIHVNSSIYNAYKKSSAFNGRNKFIGFKNGFLIEFYHLERQSNAIFLFDDFLAEIYINDNGFYKRIFNIDFNGNIKQIDLTTGCSIINSYFLLLEEEFFIQPTPFHFWTTYHLPKGEFAYFHIRV